MAISGTWDHDIGNSIETNTVSQGLPETRHRVVLGLHVRLKQNLKLKLSSVWEPFLGGVWEVCG